MKKTGRCNFADPPEGFTSYKDSSIVILPVPFGKTVSWIRGTEKGPAAIIEASGHMELYDIETDSEVYRRGIHTEKDVRASGSADMLRKVRQKVERLLEDRKFVVTLGGDHSVSLGAIQACAEVTKNMSVLHLDAHTDMRDEYEGDRLSHACVMRRVKETLPNIVSVGIRSMDASELPYLTKKKVFYAEDICSSDKWQKRVVSELSENLYISIDVDVFDTGIMPSTGTPEPGGLSWYQVISLIKTVASKKDIVGFDVVELCPSENKAPDFLAAKLIYKLLSYKYAL